MQLPISSKVYLALASSLIIIPVFYFMVPPDHNDWWMWFRLTNHALRALTPAAAIIGYYLLFLKHKRHAHYLVVLSLVSTVYLFNLDVYNMIVLMKTNSGPFSPLLFESVYILLTNYLVYIFTILLNAGLVIRRYQTMENLS